MADDDVITTGPTSTTLEGLERRAAAGKLDPMGLQLLRGLRERVAQSALEQPRESHLLSEISPPLPPESPDPPYSGLMVDPQYREMVEKMRELGFTDYPRSMEKLSGSS
tara:strand:- start:261 stop:587 length:327 start_codon:yes stop_codon:yes gene_type:complete